MTWKIAGVRYSQVYVSGPHEDKLLSWKKNGAHISTDNGKIAEEADIIFLAIKPHILAAAVANIYDTINTPNKAANKLYISILAGVKLESLEKVCIHIYMHIPNSYFVLY